jgi:antitoxin ParD1/3/4
MSISLDKRWQLFVKEQVEQGRYKTEAEVVEDGLRLIAEREAKLAELRQSIAEAIADPRRYTVAEVQAQLDERLKPSGPDEV